MHPWITGQDLETVVVAPVGDLDTVAAGSLRSALVEAAGWGLPVVVDLSHVPDLDSAALAVLVGGRNRLLAHGNPLTLLHAAPAIRRLIHTTGLDRVLPAHRGER